jgi:flavin reductase (DIM6/NTAB) family NADH-FMN oxidoreductase RutF
MTVTACCSVSVRPPRLLVSLNRRTAASTSISVAGRFGVSVLSERQEAIARFASAPDTPKFLPEAWYAGGRPEEPKWWSPAIHGSLAHLHCRVCEVFSGGDHALYLAEVAETLGSEAADEKPLVFVDGRFHTLGDVL